MVVTHAPERIIYVYLQYRIGVRLPLRMRHPAARRQVLVPSPRNKGAGSESASRESLTRGLRGSNPTPMGIAQRSHGYRPDRADGRGGLLRRNDHTAATQPIPVGSTESAGGRIAHSMQPVCPEQRQGGGVVTSGSFDFGSLPHSKPITAFLEKNSRIILARSSTKAFAQCVLLTDTGTPRRVPVPRTACPDLAQQAPSFRCP
jgi:hypothetical protein